MRTEVGIVRVPSGSGGHSGFWRSTDSGGGLPAFRYALIDLIQIYSDPFEALVDWGPGATQPPVPQNALESATWKRRVAMGRARVIDLGSVAEHSLLIYLGTLGGAFQLAVDDEPITETEFGTTSPNRASVYGDEVLLDTVVVFDGAQSVNLAYPGVGQAAKSGSLPVVVASDQVVPVSFTDQTVKLDSGGTLVGQQLRAASVPVTIASDQPAVPVSFTDQTVKLDSGGTLVGQQLRAASVPVTIASDQPAVPVSFTDQTVKLDAGGTLKGSQTSANSVPVVVASDQTVPTSTPAIPGLKVITFSAAVAASATATILAGIVNKTITVWGYSWSFASAAAKAGIYVATLQDTTAATWFSQIDGFLATAVGQSSTPRAALWIPGGLALPLSAGMCISAGANVGSVDAGGEIYYTQA